MTFFITTQIKTTQQCTTHNSTIYFRKHKQTVTRLHFEGGVMFRLGGSEGGALYEAVKRMTPRCLWQIR